MDFYSNVKFLCFVHIGRLHSFNDLWSHLEATLPSGCLPDRLDAKLVYMDGDGDWMLVLPDGVWSSFVKNAIRIMVTTESGAVGH
jgi:hypothetical protein